MFKAIIESFRRKRARRFFQEYPYEIQQFQLPEAGVVEFANWQNPLVAPKEIRQEEVDFFKKFIKKGDLVVDIGSNIGQVSVTMALLAGKEGLVLAFDPNPHVFRILEVNAGLNPDKTNIQPQNFAVTDQPAEFFYRSSEASFNNGGISMDDSNYHGRFALPTKVRGIVLEDYLNTHFPDRLPNLTLVKIDTEGYDREVIRSIRGLLETRRPVVISECFSKATTEQRREHFDLLTGLGYRLYQVDDFCENTPVVPVNTAADMNRWKHFDFFALPNA